MGSRFIGINIFQYGKVYYINRSKLLLESFTQLVLRHPLGFHLHGQTLLVLRFQSYLSNKGFLHWQTIAMEGRVLVRGRKS